MRQEIYESDDNIICEECHEQCNIKVVDNGFSFEFGSEVGFHSLKANVSSCCESTYIKGGSKLLRNVVRTARKDHRDGRIKRGDRYKERVVYSWKQNGPGWLHTTKTKLAR